MERHRNPLFESSGSPEPERADQASLESKQFTEYKMAAVGTEGSPEEDKEQEGTETTLEKRLEAGELPEEFREAWKIVDPNSPEAQQFHNEAKSLAEVLYAPVKSEEHLPNYEFKHHDFEKEPIRFLLSKDKDPNAWFVRHSKPPIVVFSEGLFVPKKEGERALVTSQNDFAAILSHEMTHLKMRQVYGNIPNSKVEEGFAYSLPLVLMYEKGRQIGLNPERVIDKSGQAGVYNLMRAHLKKGESWGGYLDVHPSADNIHSIVSNTLAYLKKEKGKLEPDVPEVQPYSENDAILKAVKESRFSTFVEQSMQQHPEYKTASCPQKVAVLESVLGSMGDKRWPTRVDDLVTEIRKLRPEVQTIEDRKAINEFANQALSLGDAGDMRTMESVYKALGGIVTKRLETPPLGRLRSISKGAKSLIESVKDYEDDKSVVAAALVFTQSLEGSPQRPGEPLLNTPDGRRFLQSIAWPQFKIPSEEQIRQGRRSGEGGAEVDWEPLRDLSARYPEVAKACVYLGLVRDPLIFEGVLRHEDIALKMAGARRGGASDIFGTIPEISSGPKEGSDVMDSLRFNADGLVVGRATVRDRQKMRGEAIDRYLDNWIEQEFSNALNDTEAQARLLKLVRGVRGDEPGQLVGLDVCDRNFQLFLKMNEIPLATEEPPVRMFLNKLTELGELGKPLLREFFNSDQGKLIILSSLSSRPFIGYAELEAEVEAEGREVGDVITNSYLTFLLHDKSFTPEEKFALFEKYLVTEKSAYVGEPTSHFQVISGSFDENQTALYLERLKPLFEATGNEQIFSPTSWQKLITSYRKAGDETDAVNLARSCLYVEAMRLLDQKTPTLRQATSFIEMMPSDLLYNSSFQAKLQEGLQIRATNFAAKDARNANLPEVVHIWQTLSKAEVIYPEMSDTILRTLVSRVEKLNDGTVQGYEQCLAMSQNLLEGGHIQEPNLRRSLITSWGDSMAGIHGIDRGNTDYVTTITAVVDKLNVNRLDRAEVLQSLAKTLQSQNGLSRELQKRAYEVTTEAFTQGGLREILTDATIDAIRKSPEHRKATLDFLTTPLSAESCREFLASGQDILEFVDKNNPVTQSFKLEDEEEQNPAEKNISLAYRQQLALSATRRFYENFWAAPIEARAVLTRELLVSPAEVLDTVDKETFDYAVAKVFTGNKEYEKESRFFLRAYIDALPHYQKHLCLGAIMAAAERQGSAELRLGETLAYFLENMGPAETKFGQAAQSHPLVPADIRQDLKRLKFHASEPARWEVTQWVEDVRTELQEQYQAGTGSTATIERIGDVIGSGSINVVAKVQMSDNKSYVLSLLRPHAEDRGHSGFETMRRMADNLRLEDTHEMVQTTRELVDQANQRLGIEVNCQLAKQQYSNAKQLYSGTAVTVDNEDYKFDSADVVAAGNNFFLMSEIPGDHYIELPEQNDEQKLAKKKYAEAILTLELNNKLRGRFDPDRHGGNVKIEAGSRNIGHFDFKSMATNEWSEEGYRQFAEVLTGALNEDKTPTQFFNDLVEQERVLRDRLQAEGKTLDPFVTEVSKGLLTDGEYAQTLDRKDLMRVVTSALLNGMHPGMQRALLETIATRIPPWFKDQYTQNVEPVVRQSLETGELSPTLQQLLPVQVNAADIIRIKRT